MKFTIERAEFFAGILTATKALPQKAVNPALDGICIEAGPQEITLMCSNQSMQIETRLAASCDSGGKILLPGRLLTEMIRKMPDGEMSLELKEEKGRTVAVIRQGLFKTNMNTLPVAEFPEMPVIKPSTTITIAQNTLREMIGMTAFSVSTDETRPILSGVLFEAAENSLRLVALDGYRFSLVNSACQCETPFKAVIPASMLNDVAKELLDNDTPVSILLNGTNAYFDLGKTKINTMQLVGQYMKYEQVIPKERLSVARINRKRFYEAVERASLMAKESKSNLIKLALDSTNMIISSNAEVGDVREDIDINLVGSEIEIAFNAKYLNDILRVIPDEEIQMVFNTNLTPAVIQPLQSERYLYLILPVRISLS